MYSTNDKVGERTPFFFKKPNLNLNIKRAEMVSIDEFIMKPCIMHLGGICGTHHLSNVFQQDVSIFKRVKLTSSKLEKKIRRY